MERLTLNQAADLAGINLSTLRAYISRGQAPEPRTDEWSGRRYYLRKEWEAYLAARPGRGWRKGVASGRG